MKSATGESVIASQLVVWDTEALRAWISPLLAPEASSVMKTVLYVKSFSSISDKGSRDVS